MPDSDAPDDVQNTLDPLFKRMEQLGTLTPVERRSLEEAVTGFRSVEAGVDLVLEGSTPQISTLLLSGFAVRYRLMEAGERQITAIHVPGDFVDLHSFLLKPMDHAVATLSPSRIALVAHEALLGISERLPHLLRLLWLLTLVDGAMHREWLVALGRRSALGRTAHLLCELYLRLRVIGLTHNHSFQLPLTQAALADTLGLSTVHTNRTLQQLRAMGLLSWQGTTVTILDWPRLVREAQFDPTYLHHNGEQVRS